jgi:purine-nucleoside phosphorylase
MQGRFHYYEGYPQSQIALAVRVMKRLGVEKLLLTNAAGGVNLNFSPGDLMLISDHINFSGSHPLIGENDADFGPRFPDQTNVYDRDLRQKVRVAAKAVGVPLQEGVYMMYSGPTFESPAEIVFSRIIGASAVGMSTVPEAIAATHCGIKTIGISLITNMAAGILNQPLSHEEVQETAAIASEKFTKLVDKIVSDVF